MLSYLDDYQFSRSNSIPKFKRAVQSFLDQTHDDKELIIVADGCDITKYIYEKYFSEYDNIKFFWTNKSKSRWPGELRQFGANLASGDWICYLDADDCILNNHLSKIDSNANGVDALLDSSLLVPFIDYGLGDITLISSKITREDLNKRKSLNKVFDFPFENWEDPGCEVKSMLIEIKDPAGTWQISHSKDVTRNVKWANEEALFGGEDKQFIEKIVNTYKCAQIPVNPTYVVCHSKNMNNSKKGLDI